MITRILCSLLLCCIPLAAHAGAVFQERGDAGDFASPQDVVGTSISSIQASIGGDDGIDVFRFHFAGGPLAIFARLDGSGQDPAGLLPIRLVRERALPGDACFAGSVDHPPNPCVSDGWLDFSADLLAPGNYLLGVCASKQDCVAEDPPFTIGFLTAPDPGAPPATVDRPVPEPGVLALIGLALLGLWSLRMAVMPLRKKPTPSGMRAPSPRADNAAFAPAGAPAETAASPMPCRSCGRCEQGRAEHGARFGLPRLRACRRSYRNRRVSDPL